MHLELHAPRGPRRSANSRNNDEKWHRVDAKLPTRSGPQGTREVPPPRSPSRPPEPTGHGKASRVVAEPTQRGGDTRLCPCSVQSAGLSPTERRCWATAWLPALGEEIPFLHKGPQPGAPAFNRRVLCPVELSPGSPPRRELLTHCARECGATPLLLGSAARKRTRDTHSRPLQGHRCRLPPPPPPHPCSRHSERILACGFGTLFTFVAPDNVPLAGWVETGVLVPGRAMFPARGPCCGHAHSRLPP